MKRSQLITIGAGCLALGCAALWARSVLWNLDHVLSTSTHSPDRKYVARLYAFGEGETPPYGNGVAVAATSALLGPYSTEDFVFKGRCEKPLISWRSPTELSLRCSKPADIVVLVHSVGEVRFSLVNGNNDAQPGAPGDGR